MQRTRRPLGRSALLAAALVGSLLVVTQPASAALDPVVLAGSMQSELGCTQDWDPACTETQLTQLDDTSTYTGVFDLPAGSYAFKVTEGGRGVSTTDSEAPRAVTTSRSSSPATPRCASPTTT